MLGFHAKSYLKFERIRCMTDGTYFRYCNSRIFPCQDEEGPKLKEGVTEEGKERERSKGEKGGESTFRNASLNEAFKHNRDVAALLWLEEGEQERRK